jgi:hypothetical protein
VYGASRGACEASCVAAGAQSLTQARPPKLTDSTNIQPVHRTPVFFGGRAMVSGVGPREPN